LRLVAIQRKHPLTNTQLASIVSLSASFFSYISVTFFAAYLIAKQRKREEEEEEINHLVVVFSF
jgi:hypothetical protein